MGRLQKPDVYTRRQWEWLAGQYRAGHGLTEISRFIDLPFDRVKTRLAELGATPETRYRYEGFREDDKPLELKKQAFYALGEEGDMDTQTMVEEAWKRGYDQGRTEAETLRRQLEESEEARTDLAKRLIRAQRGRS